MANILDRPLEGATEVQAQLALPSEHIPLDWKCAVWAAGGYTPFGAQVEYHASRAAHRVFAGGNRSGKTEAAVWEILPYLFWPNTHGWVVGAIYGLTDTIRDKLITYLTTRFGHIQVLRKRPLRAGEFWYGEKDRLLVLWTGSTLKFKSGELPKSLHAEALDYVVIDEAAQFPYEYYELLVARLADTGHFGWISSHSTFEAQTGKWFEDYFKIGQLPNTYGIVSFRHTTTLAARAGYVKPAWLYQQWLRLKALGQEDLFNARYMAIPKPSELLVLSKFSVVTHVTREAEYVEHSPVYLAVDPGGVYAVAAMQVKHTEDGDFIDIFDELYFQTTVDTTEVIAVCQEKDWWKDVGRYASPGAIDIAAKEQWSIWGNQAGLVFQRNDCPIIANIQNIALYVNAGRIRVHPRCRWTIFEAGKWSYPPVRDPLMFDPKARKPKPGYDHLWKAIGYLLRALFGWTQYATPAPARRTKKWPKPLAPVITLPEGGEKPSASLPRSTIL